MRYKKACRRLVLPLPLPWVAPKSAAVAPPDALFCTHFIRRIQDHGVEIYVDTTYLTQKPAYVFLTTW